MDRNNVNNNNNNNNNGGGGGGGGGGSGGSSGWASTLETIARHQVSGYCDARDTVGVRYELLCPAKTEIVRLGSLAPTTRATMLPRAPKGWGWRTALLYDDLVGMCTPSGALRIVAVIQLVDQVTPPTPPSSEPVVVAAQ